jgi:uncharacterized membrane protein
VGFRFQLVAMRGQADTYFALVSTPFFAVIFVSIMIYSGRDDLVPYAVIAPTLMALWTASLAFAGEMISEDRENGRLELMVAAPASVSLLVFGRLCAAMTVSVYWVESSFPRPCCPAAWRLPAASSTCPGAVTCCVTRSTRTRSSGRCPG